MGYLTLQEIGDYVREGDEIQVTDNVKKVDITEHVLRSVVEQNELAAMSRLPIPTPSINNELMKRIILSGGLSSYAHQLEQRMPS